VAGFVIRRLWLTFFSRAIVGWQVLDTLKTERAPRSVLSYP